jgi:hypothetical protein
MEAEVARTGKFHTTLALTASADLPPQDLTSLRAGVNQSAPDCGSVGTNRGRAVTCAKLNRRGTQILGASRRKKRGGTCRDFFSRRCRTTIARNLPRNGLKQNVCSFERYLRARRRKTAAAQREYGWSLKAGQRMMSNSDPDLLRLEIARREARDRLAWIRRLVPDATVLRVAEDLCAEATAAVDAYWATHKI